MAIRGRKPKPTALKVLEGNPGKRPLNDNEPKPRPIAPSPPSWLPREAKKQWKELAPALEKERLLTEVDGLAFAMLLLHWAQVAEATKILKKEGLITVDERGLPRKHPAHQILRDHSEAFRQYMAEFGLSPSARSRLNLPVQDEEDEFEAFLRAK